MITKTQIESDLIKCVEIIWNLENQLTARIPTLSSITKSHVLLKLLKRQQNLACSHRERLETICALYDHAPCIDNEQELILSMQDAKGFDTLLSSYSVSNTLITNLMQDMQEAKSQHYTELLNFLYHHHEENVSMIIMQNLKESESFVQTLDNIGSIIQDNNLSPIRVNA